MPTFSLTAQDVDLQALLRDLRQLTELESPSDDAAAVGRVQDVVETWMRALGAECHGLPGGSRQFRLGPQDPEGQNRPVLILMHADTVWPHGTLARMPYRVEGERAYGPGTYDMKGGIVGAIWALRRLSELGALPAGGVEVLLTPDEEVGSETSRALIEAAARRARAVLVVEPPVPETHALKTGRKGVGHFELHLRGVASHAGNAPEQGASAITELARLVLEAQAQACPELGTTASVGRVWGGGAVNVIPESAGCMIDARVTSLTEAARLDAGLRALAPRDPRVSLEVRGGVERPPFERLDGTARLYARAQQIAGGLGFALQEASVGGGSDGNFTAPIAPTLDGLGAPGDGAHAEHEHVRLDRWPQQVALLAHLIADPGV